MDTVSAVDIDLADLAKNVFQLHGAAADGSVVFRRRLRRDKVVDFLAAIGSRVVAMEACASSRCWARKIQNLGHEVRSTVPIYVKPFV